MSLSGFSALFLIPALSAAISEVNSFPVPRMGTSESSIFFYRKPSRDATGLLLLVPGYNGSGESMLDERWCQFADEHGLVLLAPTFRASPEQLKRQEGYYYPAQGSGAQIDEALAVIGAKLGVKTDSVLIFGFSAGAHFAHRFALWRPEQVSAFVAYSAAWWSEPGESLREVPALIMCGENDERLQATREFFQKGLVLQLPWVWRSYKDSGHEVTPAVRSMAEAFLSHYASRSHDAGKSSKGERIFGDIQKYCMESEADSIPEAVRIELPSREVAETWIKEK